MHHLQGQQGQVPISYPVGQMSVAMPPPSALGMPTVSTLPAGHSMHQQMLPGPTTAHQGPVYSQPGPGYVPPGQVAPPAVGYHAQGGYPHHMVGGGGGGGGGGGAVAYQPAQMAQQPGGVYMAAPSVEYQQYNVQGMCFAVFDCMFPGPGVFHAK